MGRNCRRGCESNGESQGSESVPPARYAMRCRRRCAHPSPPPAWRLSHPHRRPIARGTHPQRRRQHKVAVHQAVNRTSPACHLSVAPHTHTRRSASCCAAQCAALGGPLKAGYGESVLEGWMHGTRRGNAEGPHIRTDRTPPLPQPHFSAQSLVRTSNPSRGPVRHERTQDS